MFVNIFYTFLLFSICFIDLFGVSKSSGIIPPMSLIAFLTDLPTL